jgi:diguanylate cyclase (GGDEF)-like protein
MPGALERLRLLGNAGTWMKVGRFEVNTRTGERRPIPGLELGPLAEDVDTKSPWELPSWGEAASALGQGVANLPGVAAEGALYLANNNPMSLAGQLATDQIGGLFGAEGLSWEAQRAGQREFSSDLLDPYRRAKEGIGPEIPRFSESPVKSTILGGLQSAPQTAAMLATGGTGWALSGAQMADQAYEEMRGRGVPDYLAIPASAGVGGLQGQLDKIGAEGAFKGVTGNFLGRAVKGAAMEGLTETAQESIGIAGESLTGKDQDYNLVKERLGAALSGGIAMGGLLGAAPKIAGINKPAEVPIPVAHQEAAALEQKLFPARRAADYARLAVEEGPQKAAARALNDLSLQMDEGLKWEMLLDDQTNLALGREWQKIKTRVDADPEAAIVDVDLDGVKAGNDALGHDAADQLIFKPSTDAIHAVAEKYGISPRLRIRKGGDEFRLVVPANVAEQFAKDLQEAMPPKFIPLPPEAAATAGFPEGAYIQHGASIGWGGTSQEADQAMYRAKEVKPNRGAVSPGQPPFVSQTQAEEQVIQHLAPQPAAPPYVASDPATPGPGAPLSAREALAGSGALMGVPVEQVNAAVEGARGFLDKAVDVRQRYFTAEGNLPVPWMQAHEQQVQGQRAAKLAIDYMVKDYGKALKAEMASGVLPEEINSRAKKYLSGDREVSIPEPMKPILDRMRAYYDKDIAQKLIESGVARDPQHVKTILENQGEYIFRAFKMHTEPEWAKKMVGTPTFEKAVDYTLQKEDSRLQAIVDSRNQLAQEYEGKLAEIDAELQALMPGSVVPEGLAEEASRMSRGVPAGARMAANDASMALREQYAKKLQIARSRATWAQKKQAANAANQNRRAEAAGKVEGMITFDPQPVHTGGFKGLSKSWLAKRKNIPREYLDVMGEIDDPATGLVVAAERAARSIGRKEMWDDIVLGSLGKDIFDKPMPGYVHKIEGVTVPGPDGKDIELYTSKELHDAVTHAFDTAHQEAGFWDLFNGVLKANATVLSPQAMFRNFWSGFVPLVANGNLPDVFKHSASAARAAAANAGWSNNAEWRQEAIDATKHGVLGTNVDTRDLAQYLRPIVEGQGQKGPVGKVWENAQKLYAAGDNYAKLVAWKGERDRYAKAYNLHRDSEVVKARAAEVVKRTIQNYDRLPEWAKQVRKSPVIGPFVSFPASVISNVGGIYQTVAEDLKSDNPKVKQAGYVRAVSAIGTLGGIAFATPLANFFKDDDDESERVLEDVRELLPLWMKNSMLKLWDSGPGQARVIDLSFLNYYDTVTRPIQMLVRGDFAENPGQVMLGAAWETARKIFGEELALSAYADLTRGPASGGPEVVNEEMQSGVALWRVGRYALKSMAPGAIRSAARILEAEPGKRATEVGALLGPRITTINVPKSLDYSLYELQADRTAIRTSLQGALKSTALLAMPEFEANVSGFQPSMQSIYSQALDKYQRSIRLGVSPQEARASMGDKMYRPGKIMTSLLNLGATPEVAVQRAVEYEWNGLKPDLLVQVGEKKKASLADYVQSHPGATQLSIERRRLELEDWGRQAISIINSAQGQKPDPLEALRKFGAN